MIRLSCTFAVSLFSLILTQSAVHGVVREWDDEGASLNWSEAANWSDDGVPANTDDALIGSLPDAFDDSVVLDVNADVVQNLTLENGADLDLDGGRIVAQVNVSIGAGAASGATISELTVHRRDVIGNAAFGIDANSAVVGANGALLLINGGQIELDGTGILPGTLSVADGGEVHGYGLIALTDTDASLGSLSSLIANEGTIVVDDPLASGIGEPTAVQLEISAPNAPTFAQYDFSGTAGTGTISITRNATLLVDKPFLGPSKLTMAANATFVMQQAGEIFAGQTIEVNSDILNPGGVNELPAVPAVITGDGLLSMSGIIRLNQVGEELIIESPFDGIDGLITNRGTIRFRGGGNVRSVVIDDLELGMVVNESVENLEFQGGQTYETALTNSGSMGIVEFDGDASVGLKSFEQTDAGMLNLDISGDAPGEFDALSVIGDIMLDGSLEVALADMFEPAVGSSYTILSSQSGTIGGQFATTAFPTFDDRTFEVVYNASSVELQVVGLLQAGDFDADGDVDGADFLLWQQGGSPDPLSADDLSAWQSSYGDGAPSEVSAATVPEPTSLASFVIAACLFAARRRLQS